MPRKFKRACVFVQEGMDLLRISQSELARRAKVPRIFLRTLLNPEVKPPKSQEGGLKTALEDPRYRRVAEALQLEDVGLFLRAVHAEQTGELLTGAQAVHFDPAIVIQLSQLKVQLVDHLTRNRVMRGDLPIFLMAWQVAVDLLLGQDSVEVVKAAHRFIPSKREGERLSSPLIEDLKRQLICQIEVCHNLSASIRSELQFLMSLLLDFGYNPLEVLTNLIRFELAWKLASGNA